MHQLYLKGFGELVTTVGTTPEARRIFARNFLGSLFGQAVVLSGLTLVYAVTVAVLWGASDLRDLKETIGAFAFWSLMAAPLVAIVLFSALPLALRAWREHGLKTLALASAEHSPGYFRLFPYGAADRAAFKRLDGADATISAWLQAAPAPLFYLSGASGVGKSSLLAAHALPQLCDDGWLVIESRAVGDPVAKLRQAVIAIGDQQASDSDVALRDLLQTLAQARAKSHKRPVLIVIDQFEECLVPRQGTEPSPLIAVLDDLAEKPIANLSILLVFRSDYLPLLSKLALPRPDIGNNWQELGPYDRGEATAFLQDGGRHFSPAMLDQLFYGLDRIEEARGIYRPITLNMVGLVLDRMGGTSQGDPERFIQTYVRDSISAGRSRDFARAVLEQMISGAGTSKPRSEADLAKSTGYSEWQVKATLADLAKRGLVRPLEAAPAVWEISHDVLARVIAELIGRLQPSEWRRAQPFIAPLVLVCFLALAVIALPYWSMLQVDQAQDELRKLGASFSETEDDELAVTFFNTKTLASAAPFLDKAGASDLIVYENEGHQAVPLAALAKLEGLRSLTVSGVSGDSVVSLEPLAHLTSLETLRLINIGAVDLQPLTKLKNLKRLEVTNSTLVDAAHLSGLARLEELSLANTKIDNLDPLKALTGLRQLSISGNSAVKELTPTDLAPKDLAPLKGLTNLQELTISLADVNDLGPLEGLTSLRKLKLSDDQHVKDLEPIKALTSLTSLDLTLSSGITDLAPLRGLRNLERLEIFGCTGLYNLGPLKGTEVDVVGATPEQLMTMN
jgi:hypothetical protein